MLLTARHLISPGSRVNFVLHTDGVKIRNCNEDDCARVRRAPTSRPYGLLGVEDLKCLLVRDLGRRAGPMELGRNSAGRG